MEIFSTKEDCCGCTACASICTKNAIKMAKDEEGFLYPHIDTEKCVNCGLCASVCPVKNNRVEKFTEQKAFIVRSCNEENVSASTSGGFFLPIAEWFIDQGGYVVGVCYDAKLNVVHKITNALSYSHSDEFIIEDFITQHGYSSDTDSFSIDGELKFVSFDCQHFDREAKNPYTPAAYSWPSSMSVEHQEELKNEIQRLLKLLKMRTAVYNIETREGTDGKAYIMELSPRGGGNRLSECLRYATGVDMITNMVKYSVGLPVDEITQKPYDGCWAEIILHSDEPGVFKELWISNEIASNVVERDLWIEEGASVGGFEAANEAIGTLVLKFENQERIEEVLGNQNKYVKVKLK